MPAEEWDKNWLPSQALLDFAEVLHWMGSKEKGKLFPPQWETVPSLYFMAFRQECG